MRFKPRTAFVAQEWHRRFALVPRQMADGTWVWLEFYERRWVSSSAGGFWRRRVDDSFEGLLP